MIPYHQYAQMQTLRSQGYSGRQIARILQVNPKTVRAWFKKSIYRIRRSVRRASRLDPFKPQIIRLLDQHAFTAQQIFQKIHESGYQGHYPSVKKYVRKIRPPKAPAFLTLAFAPGECAQLDWGEYGTIMVENTVRKLYFLIMVLAYCRMTYVFFSLSQAMEHFLLGQEEAFLFFGGVPQKIMVDNLKTAVIKREPGKEPVFNQKYMEFAQHYGFKIVPCGVGQPQEKGRVENGVGYLKKNFLAGLPIPCLEALQDGVNTWLKDVANVRIHGTTKKRPVDMFEQERSALLPLTVNPFDEAVPRRVRASSQFRVTVDTNHYSVPAEYASRGMVVKAYSKVICVYYEEKLVARHLRSYGRNKDIEDPEHPKALLAERRKAEEQRLLKRFLGLSPVAEDFWRALEDRKLNARHHVRRILGLSEIFGAEAVERALRDAAEWKVYSADYVENILEQRKRILPEPGPLQLTRTSDLLDLDLPKPDLEVYQRYLNRQTQEEEKGESHENSSVC